MKRLITEAVAQKLVLSTTGSTPEVKPWSKVMDAFPIVPKEDLEEIDAIVAEGRRLDLEMQQRGDE